MATWFRIICGPIAFGMLLAGCGQTKIQGTLLQRVERPGGGVSAIVTRTDGGATVAFGYRVYLQMSHSPGQSVEVLRFDKGDPPKVIWTSKKTLLLKVGCGQIFNFSNFADVWPQDCAADFEQIVVSLENHGVCKY